LNIDLKNKKVLTIIIVLILMSIILYTYYKIIYMHRNNNIFAQESEKYSQEANNPVFKIDKVLMYSDANIEDLSEDKNLSQINISQFTDFAIYIDNKVKSSDITAENTINKLYVDNISITDLSMGQQKIFYKDVNDFCKYKSIKDGVNKIDYKVIHTNEEKSDISDANRFYTDCSEPFIVSYVNENIVKNRDVSNLHERISLDGSMLKLLDISLDELNYKISFRVNIENNLGEIYYCNMLLNVNLNSEEGGIYTGYIMQIHDLKSFDYRFRKLDTENNNVSK